MVGFRRKFFSIFESCKSIWEPYALYIFWFRVCDSLMDALGLQRGGHLPRSTRQAARVLRDNRTLQVLWWMHIIHCTFVNHKTKMTYYVEFKESFSTFARICDLRIMNMRWLLFDGYSTPCKVQIQRRSHQRDQASRADAGPDFLLSAVNCVHAQLPRIWSAKFGSARQSLLAQPCVIWPPHDWRLGWVVRRAAKNRRIGV